MNTCCKAVIFDLDGTLLDTIKDLGNSMNYILTKHGFPKRENDHFVRSIGNGLRKFAERCLPQSAVSEELLDVIVPELVEHYGKHYAEKTVVFDGITELLDFLRDEKISINILSNKRDEFVKELMPIYFADYNFDCVIGELPDIPRKPDPTSALEIANRCNILPSDILFIGDSIYDIITGKNAGMKTLAVTWGYQPKELLISEEPDFVADSPSQIIEYIKTFK